jgi:hypothetical protein
MGLPRAGAFLCTFNPEGPAMTTDDEIDRAIRALQSVEFNAELKFRDLLCSSPEVRAAIDELIIAVKKMLEAAPGNRRRQIVEIMRNHGDVVRKGNYIEKFYVRLTERQAGE